MKTEIQKAEELRDKLNEILVEMGLTYRFAVEYFNQIPYVVLRGEYKNDT